MKSLIFVTVLSFMAAATASTIGISTHPFESSKRAMTAEFNTYLSSGSGTGVTLKYFQKLNNELNIDAGVGFAEGDRSSRVFVGADYEIFPDYGRQPRFSLKGLAETMSFNGDRVNSFGVAPTASKGFLFWGKEAFPFVSLPTRLSLNSDTSSYETQIALATGITGRIKIDGMKELIANFETNFNLRNSFTSFVFGVSLPL